MEEWSKISDQDLDGLFRSSAENQMPEFEESAWEQMSAILDDDSNKKPIGGALRKYFIGGAMLIALLGLTYFYNQNTKFNTSAIVATENTTSGNTADSLKKEQKSTIINQDVLAQNSSLLNEDTKNESESIELNKEAENDKLPANGKSSNQLEAPNALELNIQKTAKNKNAFKSTTEIPLKTNKYQLSKNSLEEAPKLSYKENNSQGPSLTNNPEISEQSSKKSNLSTQANIQDFGYNTNSKNFTSKENLPNNIITNEPKNLIEKEEELASNKFLQIEKLKSLKSKAYIVQNKNLKIGKKETLPYLAGQHLAKKQVPERLSLRIGISPDWSMISNNKIFKTGHNFQFLLEYRLNEKWSINSGIMKSMKYYDAYGSQYKWPSDWTNSSDLDKLVSVNAQCNMLDIPLNIRYNYHETPKLRLFGTLGSTSYLMLNEKYDYNYEKYYYPTNGMYKWEGKTGFYAFGVLNMSTGLEYKLNKGISLQFEPFYKLPFKSIGHGYVKLSSFGTFVSTRISIH